MSDVLLAPFQPSSFDLWSLEKTELLYTEMQPANAKLKGYSPIAESGEYWWNPRRPDQPSLWDTEHDPRISQVLVRVHRSEHLDPDKLGDGVGNLRHPEVIDDKRNAEQG